MRKHGIIAAELACLLVLAGCGAGGESGVAESESGRDGNIVETDTGQGMPAGQEERQSDAPGGEKTEENEKTGMDVSREIPGETDGQAVIYRLRIVDGAESGSLVLAGEGSAEVYTLVLHRTSAGNADGSASRPEIPVFLDGQPADYTALEDGMTVEVAFVGSIEECYPAQFGNVESVSAYSLGTERNPGGGYYDLCGLYLQVLNDLWDKDAGLNSDVSLVSLDMSEAPGGLTKGEREAVAWIFGCEHGVDSLTLNYEELKEQGYLTEADAGSGLYQWEDGVLFSITSAEWAEGELYSLPVIKFDAKKWRSPRGAYFLMDCAALWPEMGTWSDYEIGGEAIS